MKNCFIPFISILLLASCELPFENATASRDFVIRAGEHYASPRLYETFNSGRLRFKATFDESAKYEFSDSSLQTSKNKLMGFSDCSSLHHENSARFAWQWLHNRIEIFAYCYVDSMRVEQFIAPVNLNEENLFEIEASGGEYVFYLNGERKVSVARTSTCSEGVNYMLYPYFGGTEPAPHDVNIKIEMVK
ncbi:MAG TPA: hypothetical protein VF490_07545 [Chryseosolibacter sp.]